MTVTKPPWTNAYGLARTVLASATLLTLLANPVDTLFRPLGITNENLLATVSFSRLSLFHLAGADHLALGKAIAIAILCLAASGWRPRISGILHWWVAASFAASTILLDGGDQANAILTLLMVPLTLTDSRPWHWSAPKPLAVKNRAAVVIAQSCLTMIGVQMAVIYFVASTSKFSSPEWANGTALYYWFTQPVFGMDARLGRFIVPLLSKRFVVVPATWSVLMLEVTLAGLVFASYRRRRKWLLVAIGFHAGIAVVHGLVTFAMTMIAGLWLYLRRADRPIHMPAWLPGWVGSRRLPPAELVSPREEPMPQNLAGEFAE